jgi:hypothetical protein
MDILTFIVVLVVIGFVLWLLTTYVPMPEPYKRAVIVIVVLLIVIWAVRLFFVQLPVIGR